MKSQITAVIGAQWGDEGKGKLVDILGESHSIIVRSGGGANAGHTIVRDGKKYVFHLLPSGMLTEKNIGIIGNGCVVHLPSLLNEIENLESQGLSVKNRVFISDRAHLLFQYHRDIDAIQEEQKGKMSIGTTKRGIGPCYSDKISRNGIRAVDAKDINTLQEKLELAKIRVEREWGIEVDVSKETEEIKKSSKWLSESIIDTASFLEKKQAAGEGILLEGAQAFMLDIDFGTYPFVTSSSINVGGMAAGCGVPARNITEIIGVIKAYCTRVGSGPFPSELKNGTGDLMRKIGHEFGATTGRPRRCGWIDIVALKSFVQVNQPDAWNVTKLDVLDTFDQVGMVTAYQTNTGEILNTLPANTSLLEEITPIVTYYDGWNESINQCRTWDELPKNAQKFLEAIEEKTGVKVKYIGVGAGNNENIKRG